MTGQSVEDRDGKRWHMENPRGLRYEMMRGLSWKGGRVEMRSGGSEKQKAVGSEKGGYEGLGEEWWEVDSDGEPTQEVMVSLGAQRCQATEVRDAGSEVGAQQR